MTVETVSLADGAHYDIHIQQELLESIGASLRNLSHAQRALIITDSEVATRYAPPLKASLESAGFIVSQITLPAGEEAKSIECASEVWQAMIECRLSRESIVLALGGGVVGDLSGFCASTYMRGLRYVQVPTTLLAMVDSSVGGKTAINLAEGKNLVGTFWQPLAVFADVSVLATLPDREWQCGCAEIVKTAAIDSSDFFFWLVDHAYELAERDRETTTEAIRRSVQVKAGVVAEDAKELKGVRECLNYGHTLAHAIETLAGYGTYSHGAAVSQGMRFAARLGASCVGTDRDFIAAQDALLDALGLYPLPFQADPEELYRVMMGDKKVRNSQLRFVLPRTVGQWELVSPEKDLVIEHLQAWQQRVWEDK